MEWKKEQGKEGEKGKREGGEEGGSQEERRGRWRWWWENGREGEDKKLRRERRRVRGRREVGVREWRKEEGRNERGKGRRRGRGRELAKEMIVVMLVLMEDLWSHWAMCCVRSKAHSEGLSLCSYKVIFLFIGKIFAMGHYLVTKTGREYMKSDVSLTWPVKLVLIQIVRSLEFNSLVHNGEIHSTTCTYTWYKNMVRTE